jgi:hypothetical protein
MMAYSVDEASDAAGKPLGTLAAARDITPQKELESQLRDSQFYTGR